MACSINPQARWARPTLLGLLLVVGGGCTTAAQRAQGRPWIHKVYLDGVKQVKAGELRDKIAAQQSPWFPLAPKRYLDQPYAVEVVRARIEAFGNDEQRILLFTINDGARLDEWISSNTRTTSSCAFVAHRELGLEI